MANRIGNKIWKEKSRRRISRKDFEQKKKVSCRKNMAALSSIHNQDIFILATSIKFHSGEESMLFLKICQIGSGYISNHSS